MPQYGSRRIEIRNALLFYVVRCTEVPSAPRNVTVVECGKDFVNLSWQCPATDGGSPVIQYIIEMRDVTGAAAGAGGDGMWVECATVVAPNELSVRVRDLLQGNSYLFRVSAENHVGAGPPTALRQPVVTQLPYGALCF